MYGRIRRICTLRVWAAWTGWIKAELDLVIGAKCLFGMKFYLLFWAF